MQSALIYTVNAYLTLFLILVGLVALFTIVKTAYAAAGAALAGRARAGLSAPDLSARVEV